MKPLIRRPPLETDAWLARARRLAVNQFSPTPKHPTAIFPTTPNLPRETHVNDPHLGHQRALWFYHHCYQPMPKESSLTVSQPWPGFKALKSAVDWLCSSASLSPPATRSLPQCDLSTRATPWLRASITRSVFLNVTATPASCSVSTELHKQHIHLQVRRLSSTKCYVYVLLCSY